VAARPVFKTARREVVGMRTFYHEPVNPRTREPVDL
jgi:hypothetical protein